MFDAVSFSVHHLLDSFRPALAETFYIQLVVDLLADASEPRPKVCRCLLPWDLRSTSCLPVSNPRHSCLMQKDILHVAWLCCSIVSIVSLQLVLFKTSFEFMSDVAAIWYIETWASIHKHYRRLVIPPKPDVQCCPHLLGYPLLEKKPSVWDTPRWIKQWGPARFLASTPKSYDQNMWGCNKIIRMGRNGLHSSAFAIEMKQLLGVRLEARASLEWENHFSRPEHVGV